MLLDARDPAAPDLLRRLAPLVEAAEPCQAPEYVQRIGEAAGRRVFVVAPDHREAAACVTVRRLGPWRQVILPPFTPYSAVFATPAGSHALAEAFETAFDETILHLPPGDAFGTVAAERGWQVRTLGTFVLDPRIARDPSTWSPGAARNFRRGAQTLRAGVEADGASTVASLCAASYGRNGRRPPLPADRFASLAGSVVSARLGDAWVCRDAAGTPVAGVVTLRTGPRSSYWMAGGMPGDGMTVLLGTLFDRLAEDGVEHFDFVGANTPSIAEFKRRFGGRRAEYAVVRHTRSRWLSFARTLRDRARGGRP